MCDIFCTRKKLELDQNFCISLIKSYLPLSSVISWRCLFMVYLLLPHPDTKTSVAISWRFGSIAWIILRYHLTEKHSFDWSGDYHRIQFASEDIFFYIGRISIIFVCTLFIIILIVFCNCSSQNKDLSVCIEHLSSVLFNVRFTVLKVLI